MSPLTQLRTFDQKQISADLAVKAKYLYKFGKTYHYYSFIDVGDGFFFNTVA